MAWDDDKSTAADADNPAPDEQLTADEWDAHVNEGHFPSDELQLGVNGNGDPVYTDPQNGDQEVMRYDRSAGAWVPSGLELDGADVSGVGSLSTEELSNIADQIIGPTDSIQNAIDAADPYDTIYLGSGRYRPDSVPVVDKPLSLIGETLHVVSDEPHPDSRPARLEGTVIEPQSAGQHGLEITVSGDQVNIKNIGITWPDTLKDSDTGHGIYGNPPDDGSGYQEDGVFNGEIKGIAVVGVDGNHYGIEMTNSMHLTAENWMFWGGGGWHHRVNHAETNLGNSTYVNFYCRLDVPGSAAGIKHTATNTNSTLSAYLRPQINMSGDIKDNDSKVHLDVSESDGGEVLRKGYYHLDVESVNNPNGDSDLGRSPEVTFAIRDSNVSFTDLTYSEDEATNHRINDVSTRNTEVHGTRAVRFDETSKTPPPVSNGIKLHARGDNSAQFLHEDGSLSFKIYKNKAFEGLSQDLSNLSLGGAEIGRIYRHDGTSSINADGGTTSSAGYYAWGGSEFKSIAQW